MTTKRQPIHVDPNAVNFKKSGGLVPAIIQDAQTDQVLMLGYMNEESLARTCQTLRVTFFSRSKNRLWVKGEESGNFLNVESIAIDCDQDTLLIRALPCGPTCHTGAISCFQGEESILWRLTRIIQERAKNPSKESYTSSLLQSSPSRIAQKVGEEGVEVALATVTGSQEELMSESADLIFHLLVALQSRGITLSEVLEVLNARNGSNGRD